MTEHDPDALALASMIADHLRGIPIDVRDLPPSAWRLVAGYVAVHDHGTVAAAGPTGATFMGAPLQGRVVARGPDGEPLPDLPKIRRGRGRVIDTEPGGGTPGCGALPGVGGTVVC